MRIFQSPKQEGGENKAEYITQNGQVSNTLNSSIEWQISYTLSQSKIFLPPALSHLKLSDVKQKSMDVNNLPVT